ncbi:MAG: serine O-acetyltransferase, partial [Desulfobacterales bacterium]
MADGIKLHETTCKTDMDTISGYRETIPEIAEKIIDSCNEKECYTHIDFEPIPSKDSVVEIITRLQETLFPGYFTREKLDPVNLGYNIGQSVSILFDMISEQICRSIRHDCLRYNQVCSDCAEQGNKYALVLLKSIPSIRRTLATDIQATFEGDPAAKSYDEIIFSYPGIFAIMVYRVAHLLFEHGIPLLPRIMTEHAHSLTGIDIHPGAQIGERFVIDHGTAVVIGETT